LRHSLLFDELEVKRAGYEAREITGVSGAGAEEVKEVEDVNEVEEVKKTDDLWLGVDLWFDGWFGRKD